LVALIPSTGQELWRYAFPYSTSTGASPVVCDNIVYCSAAYNIGAAGVRISKAGDGLAASEVWRKSRQLMNHWATPVYHEGYLYGLYGHGAYGDAPLKCVQASTGKEMWSQPGFGLGGVLRVGEHLLVLSDFGDLVLVKASPTAYSESARFNAVAGKCWNLAAISQGRIYARSTQEAVCLDVAEESGAPLQLAAEFASPDGIRLVVRATDGSAIQPSRTNNIQILTSSQPDADLAQWSLVPVSWDLTNGILLMHEAGCTNWLQRFYLSRENP
jgi:hypothetical protein